ncbi:hypothetical protein KAT80_01775 [Candidatus Pacearchaeota archaeon]|nr:hypothetical protein [Candidatus Pacearchaeota archaeon]
MTREKFYKDVEEEVFREMGSGTLYPNNEEDRNIAEKVFRNLGYHTKRIKQEDTNLRRCGLKIWRE